MTAIIIVFTVLALLIIPVINDDVCKALCHCNDDVDHVYCDSKNLTTLETLEFPSNVAILTLNDNNLKFDTTSDLSKISQLKHLTDLSINQNPLNTIPPFEHTQLRTLLLRDASLTSAEFPSSYNNSRLQRVSISNNKINSITEKDFVVLCESRLLEIEIDNSSVTNIDQNAFAPLTKLELLLLNDNNLTSCEFLSSAPSLSSIHLDGNQFTSLPQQLVTPGNIKTYSFRRNLITVINESSPLNIWLKNNLSDIGIFLVNNTFDCCLSKWFIGFLKVSPGYVRDASLLTCSAPANLAGQLLVELNPDNMNCNGDTPTKPSSTILHAIGLILGSISALLIGAVVYKFIMVWIKRRQAREDYMSLVNNNNTSPGVNSWLANSAAPSRLEMAPVVNPTTDGPDVLRTTHRAVAPTDQKSHGYGQTDKQTVIPNSTSKL